MQSDYRFLIGKNKKEVLNELGEEFNYYPDCTWHYLLKKYRWFGKKKLLFINFNKKDEVVSIEIIIKYGNI